MPDKIYTIGNRESYENAFHNSGIGGVFKMGRNVAEKYEGGIVFQTVEDAQAYIEESFLGKYSIYAVAASWNADTYTHEDGHHYLLRDAWHFPLNRDGE